MLDDETKIGKHIRLSFPISSFKLFISEPGTKIKIMPYGITIPPLGEIVCPVRYGALIIYSIAPEISLGSPM